MATQYFEHDGGRIAYEQQGSGPLVICVPSMGDLRGEYRFLLPQLAAAGYRAVSMDVRGHGETSTGWADVSVGAIGGDILALIRHLNAGPAVIVGTSMAAGAAVWAAAEGPAAEAPVAEGPELVRGLVLIGPFVRGEGSWASRLLYTLLFARPWGPAMWIKYFSTLYPARKPADFEAYTAALRANLAQPGRMEALKAMMMASKAASEQRLPRVQVPTLVLMGTQDPDFKPPQAEAQWVTNALRGTLHMIEGAGHYPHAEMPEVIGPLVLSFLQSLSMRATPSGPTPSGQVSHAA